MDKCQVLNCLRPEALAADVAGDEEESVDLGFTPPY